MPDATGNRRTERWLEERLETWNQLAQQLPELADNKPAAMTVVLDVMRHYPELARDLAIARRISPDGRLTRYLQQTYASLHRSLFRRPASLRRDLLRLFSREVPQAAWQLRRQIGAVGSGFLAAVFAGWWLVATYPELASLFASERMIDAVQRGELWTDGLLNVFPSSLLAARILTNNIVVALVAVSLGSLYGLGTIYIIGINGLMLGGIFAFTAQNGMAGKLFEFVCAHGFVELTVICVAGAIGFSIGEALARPGQLRRADAFQRASRRGARLLAPCVVFLFGAGIIEGYVSPDPHFSLGSRLAIGIGYWLLFLLAMTGFRIPWRKAGEAVHA